MPHISLERESGSRLAELDRFIDLMLNKTYQGPKAEKEIFEEALNSVFRKYVLSRSK